MDFEKLKREELAAEQAAGFNTSTDETVLPTREETLTTVAPIEVAEVDVTPVEVPPTVVKPVEPRVSWKKRYATYKASTDNTLFELRKDKAALNAQIASHGEALNALRTELASLRQAAVATTDPFKDVFTPEDEELIGTEAVDIFKKAMKHQPVADTTAIDNLQAELAELKQANKVKADEDLASLDAESLEDMKRKLAKIVPDWSAIDLEEDFGVYIQDIDPYTGAPRAKYFGNAVEQRDVSGVARFYQEYKSLKPKSREDILAAKVSPVGGGAAAGSGTDQGGKKPTYSMSAYNKFMDEFSRGKYRRTKEEYQEAKKTERLYDLALMEGRVV